MQIQNSFVVTGDWKFRIINDGHFYLNPITNDKDNAPKVLPANINHFAVNFLLAESRNATYLVDLGLGTIPNNIFERIDQSRHISILTKLKSLLSSKLSAIIFSHLHIDHIGNYLEFHGSSYEENFPNIPCYVSRLEWELRTARLNKADNIYRKYYHCIEKNIHLTEDGQEILPDITAQFIGGHTPGHQTIIFRSKENALCYSGDLIATEAQLLKNRSLPFDFDPEYSNKLCEKLLKQGQENRWIIALNHSPHVNFKLLEKTKKNE